MSGETIRPYRPDDARALSALYEASVRELGAKRYSTAQIHAWASLTPSAERLDAKMQDGRVRLVSEDESGLLAFVDVEPDGHIDLLYAAPRAAGTGVADRLYLTAEQQAAKAGATRLYAEASELARPFFEKRGFVTTARRDFEVAGVPIHNFAVEKAL